MKILHIVHGYPPNHVGGTELYTYNLARLQAKKNDVYVFTRDHDVSKKAYHVSDEMQDNVHIRRINITKENNFKFRDKKIEEIYTKYISSIKPDIAHFQHCISLSAELINITKRHGIPSIMTLHDYWFICPRVQLLTLEGDICTGPEDGTKCYSCMTFLKKYRILKKIKPVLKLANLKYKFKYRIIYMKKILKKLDLVISPSYFVKEKFSKYVNPDKIIICPHGMNTKDFKNINLNNEINTQKITFGYIGTIMEHKGLHVLVKAFNKIKAPNVFLEIYGDTSIDPEYVKFIKKDIINENININGVFENVVNILPKLDVLVVPSVWNETYSIVTREAFLAKIPVIASNIGALPEIITPDKNGYLFTPNDPEELYKIISKIIEDPQIIKNLKEFPIIKDIEEHVKEIDQIYKKITKI